MLDQFANHKLTAILYADIAAYSRLIERDAVGMHQRVMDAMDFVSAAIADSGGKVLRYAGDAILAESPGLGKLAQTAIDIQRALADRNADLEPDDRIQIRIGLNIDEVLEDPGEIFGEGVNLAARLEAAAQPGGICISANVHDQVAGCLGVEFADGGKQRFKNVSQPVQVYHWCPESPAKPVPGKTTASLKMKNQAIFVPLRARPSVGRYWTNGKRVIILVTNPVFTMRLVLVTQPSSGPEA